jgi:hypothetical protein
VQVPDFTERDEKELLINDKHSKSNPDRPSSFKNVPQQGHYTAFDR